MAVWWLMTKGCIVGQLGAKNAESGLPSVRSLPWFLISTTDSAATQNLLGLQSEVVQERESGQREMDHY